MYLDIQKDHGMVQQVSHFWSSSLLAFLPFKSLTQLPGLLSDLAAQQLLIAR
jgi:hypothetical protein